MHDDDAHDALAYNPDWTYEWILTFDHKNNRPVQVHPDAPYNIKFILYTDNQKHFTGYMTEHLFKCTGVQAPLDYARAYYGCTSMTIGDETYA